MGRKLPPYPPDEHATPGCDCTGKMCAGCGEVKCLGFFHRRRLFGYRSKCKACRTAESTTDDFRKHRREKYWENAEESRAKLRDDYWRNPEKHRGHAKEYRQNNLEKKKEYDRIYNRSEKGKESERRRYQRHSEKIRARGRAWREANPERVRQNDRAWREANPERARLNAQAWNEANQERARLNRRAWNEANPERVQLHAQIKNANRRAHVKRAGGKYTTAEWEALRAMYYYTCLCCGRQEPEITLEPDHVVPLANGGANTIDNIQPLCMNCNRRKGSKIIDYRV